MWQWALLEIIKTGNYFILNLFFTCTVVLSFPIEKRNSPNYLYKPETVRGKARMELPGWSCKQCRDVCIFYIFFTQLTSV